MTPVEILSEKIDSKEKWEEVSRKLDLTSQTITASGDVVPSWAAGTAKWWAIREAKRIAYGVYKTSTELDTLNKRFGILAHISVKDKTLVAYTPDNQAGERDAQATCNPGRLFSKYYTVASEDFVRQVTENHIAEAYTEVEFIEGPAIAEAYRAMANTGLSSCMTKQTLWSVANDPTQAYDAKGVKLAVVRDTTGKLIARTLVYEHNEKDKRYIRTYGAPMISKKLKELGYRVGNLAGAKLKAVPWTNENGDNPLNTSVTKFAFPYLDADGGPSNGKGSNIAWIDDHIMVVPATYQSLLIGYYHMPSAGGTVSLTKVPDKVWKGRCAMSGKDYNLFDEETDLIRFYNSVTQESSQAIMSVYYNHVPAEDGSDVIVIAKYLGYHQLRAFKRDTVVINQTTYVNTEENLSYYNLVKLDEEMYPGEFAPLNEAETVGDKRVKASDTFAMVNASNSKVLRLKKDLENKVFKKSLIKLFGRDKYAEQGAEIITTQDGKKVHKELHEIGQYLDGTYGMRRGSAVKHKVSGVFYLLPSGTLKYQTEGLVKASRAYVINTLTKWALQDGVTSWSSVQGFLTSNNMRAMHNTIMSADDRNRYDWHMYGEFNEPSTEILERFIPILAQYSVLSKAVAQKLALWLAEAKAVEYPNQLVELAVLPEVVAVLPNPEIEVV